MFDKLKSFFKSPKPLEPIPDEVVKAHADEKKRAKKPSKSEKELATEKGEPYVAYPP